MKCPSCGADAAGKFCSNCGGALGGASCPSCSAPLSPGARFCHVCGAALGAVARRPAAPHAALPWVVAGVTVAVLIVVLVARFGGSTAPPPATAPPTAAVAPPFAGAGPGGAATTDISQMTPRERADRLYNRIMTAVENGNPGEVTFFGPMALQAYAMLGTLDADARYHVGLIQAAIGNEAGTVAQADSIQSAAPRHLFAPLLRWEIASRHNDTAALRRAYRQFLDNYDREMASGKPEYDEHRPRLQSFHDEARGALGGGAP